MQLLFKKYACTSPRMHLPTHASPCMQLLFKKYDDDGEGSVNYVAFSRDVDSAETFSDRSLASSLSRNPKLYGGFRNPRVNETMLRASV